MTPKEKAEELVDKLKTPLILSDTDAGQEIICTGIAKQCALIAVDEIINSSPSLPILGDTYIEDIGLSKIYWEEVKKEIDKL